MMLATLIILAVLFFFSTFFSLAETAFFSLTKIDKDFIKRTHPRVAKWVLNHIEHPRRTLSTILVGNLIANTWATAIVACLN